MIQVYIRLLEYEHLGSAYNRGRCHQDMLYGLETMDREITADNQCIMVTREIESPKVKTNFVDLPTAYDGTYDMSVVNGMRLGDKTIKVKLRCVKDYDVNEFKAIYLGRQIGIRFSDEELGIYHVGRLVSIDDDYQEWFRTFELEIQAAPYRRELPQTMDEWERRQPSRKVELTPRKLADINLIASAATYEAVSPSSTLKNGTLSTTQANTQPVVRVQIPITEAGEYYLYYSTTGGYARVYQALHQLTVRSTGSFDVGDASEPVYLYLYAKDAAATFGNIAVLAASSGTICDAGDKAYTQFTLHADGAQPASGTALKVLANGVMSDVKTGSAYPYSAERGIDYNSIYLVLPRGRSAVFLLSDANLSGTKFYAAYTRQVI